MVGSRNSPARSFTRPHRPILLERSSSGNTWLIGSCSLEDIISSPIRSDRALESGGGGGIVAAVRFNDVVLDQRICCPAVNGEVAVSVGGESAGVGDCAGNLLVFCDIKKQE